MALSPKFSLTTLALDFTDLWPRIRPQDLGVYPWNLVMIPVYGIVSVS